MNSGVAVSVQTRIADSVGRMKVHVHPEKDLLLPSGAAVMSDAHTTWALFLVPLVSGQTWEYQGLNKTERSIQAFEGALFDARPCDIAPPPILQNFKLKRWMLVVSLTSAATCVAEREFRRMSTESDSCTIHCSCLSAFPLITRKRSGCTFISAPSAR